MSAVRIPLSTYRLQFNERFTFRDARAIVDYLHALGISDCYASSYLKAVPGSPHGYDVADPTSAQSRSRHRRRLLGLDRGAALARHGTRPRPRAESHGHREIGEPVVAGRARERPELALRALLRHRVASGQGRAGRQGADSDSRRSVRRGARAQELQLDLPRRRVRRALLRRRAADCAGYLCRDPSPDGSTRGWPISRAPDGRRAAEHPDGEPQPAVAQRRATRKRSRRARAKRKSSSGGSPRSPAQSADVASLDRRERPPDQRRRRPAAQLRRARRAAQRAVVSPRALARRLRGDQLPAVLRRQPARGAADGRSGGLRGGAPLRVRAGRARRAPPACASITSTASTRRTTTCGGCRRAAADAGTADEPFLRRRREDSRRRRAAAARLAGARHDRLRVRRRRQQPVRGPPQRAGARRHLPALRPRASRMAVVRRPRLSQQEAGACTKRCRATSTRSATS